MTTSRVAICPPPLDRAAVSAANRDPSIGPSAAQSLPAREELVGLDSTRSGYVSCRTPPVPMNGEERGR
jgi:hypothetical protein